jgi:YD repeat-containing protein
VGRGRFQRALACAALLAASDPSASQTITYSYDALGRLIATSSSGNANNGLATSIAYDAAGNRKSYHVTGAGPGGAAGIVAAGSFETPLGVSYAYNPTVSGATFTGFSGIAATGSAWNFATAPDGTQVAFIEGAQSGNGAIALTVSGLTPGAYYVVRFWTAQRPGFPANPIAVAFGGTALGSFTPSSTAFVQTTTRPFTAPATSGTLTFTGSAYGTDIDTAIDAVSVVPAS